MLTKYYHKYPQEKVYLQPDRQLYQPGETIWFSGYVTCYSRPSHISNILYVELFNDRGFVTDRAMLQVHDGVVSGEFSLPSATAAGKYYMRAYTAWMLNFSTSGFFYETITVGDKGIPEKKKPIEGQAGFSVHFFPESGHLVSRLTSLVVFKAVDTNGLPVNVSGKVFNNLGDTVAVFKTTHDGTGSFVTHCSPQNTYAALVTANGSTKKILLPVVQQSGVVLHVQAKNNGITDSIFFHISRSGINKEKFENLVLCAQMDDHFSVTKIHFTESAVNDPLDTVLTAPYPLLLNNFGEGILHLSVITETGNILAERLVYLHAYQPAVQQPLINNLPDQKNFVIRLPADYTGKLAVSVTDADSAASMVSNASIHSALFSAAGINGTIHAPEWYFENDNPQAAHALDLLMITGETAGVDLQQILDGDEPLIKYLPEKSISLKGRAFEMHGGVAGPLISQPLFLMLKSSKDSVSRALTVLTDTAESFAVTGLDFNDTANIYVQTGTRMQGSANKVMSIEFFKDVFDSISRSIFVVAPAVLNTGFFANNPDTIQMNGQPGLLKNVTVTGIRKTHIDSVLAQYATGMFANPGSWAQTLDLTNDQHTKNSDQDVLAWLNGKAGGLNYSYSNGRPLIYWRFSNFIAGLSGVDQIKLNAPAFFLNESLLNAGPEGYDGAVDMLLGIRMADVALIRVYKPGTMPNVPDNGPHGSIAIYLKKGAETDKPSPRTLFQQAIKIGYKPGRHFDDLHNGTPLTGTLYWNPTLKVDAVAHTASFSFNSNGYTKHFRIVAAGLDENGSIIRLNRVVQ